jgi:hypothetical protein
MQDQTEKGRWQLETSHPLYGLKLPAMRCKSINGNAADRIKLPPFPIWGIL